MNLSKTSSFKSSRLTYYNQYGRKGFTLIELLIVIAVIGVLASVVLAVMNPLEQLAKSRDAGRRNYVTQLGKAVSAYNLGSSTGAWPGSGTSWQDALAASGTKEISSPVTAPALNPQCSVSEDNGFCYTTLGTTDAAVWTLVESSTEKVKVPACTAAGNVVAVVWIASQGKTGLTCLNTAATSPTAGAVLY